MPAQRATVLAGIPADNSALFHRVRFGCGDPAAWLRIDGPSGSRTEFIVRDIERQRAAQRVPVDRVSCPADYPPAGGLSGDRATATAQAVAECLRGQGVTEVTTDRSLPYIFAWHMQQAGLRLKYDPELGVLDRRVKDEQELQWLAEAQQVTEQARRLAWRTVARASADAEGVLHWEAAELTSERLQRMIAQFLLDRDYLCPRGLIAASLPHSADCHARGEGPLRTGQAVVIDIFPQSAKTRTTTVTVPGRLCMASRPQKSFACMPRWWPPNRLLARRRWQRGGRRGSRRHHAACSSTASVLLVARCPTIR